MKHIIKSPEPQALTDWKAQDKKYIKGLPNFERIKGLYRRPILNSLRVDQGNICCYCERTLKDGDCHIEHLMPQEYYEEYSCEYDNMLACCQLNLAPKEPRHCGVSKGSWYDDQLMISPLQADCETKFMYTADGRIYPSIDDDEAADLTILHCQLNIDRLAAERGKIVETFIDPTLSEDDLIQYVKNYLAGKEANNGSYNPFYTTIQYLFGGFII
ncbi:retron system putative HNH endonuclease [Mucilaginibacter paludis]|uniref:TIGR02646 family protein n=1 Tax=Mucilaginibacter paludis DSM 18603 TaxID=714943 RepID=H1YCM8_9SPHI|nr:retron system putative HNH endonuclease [Mucilaginibacter paludis]EHQ24215.1 Conserved hypothetical protein CHP02646 [Mucilaginibacter paludis DSM 18603]